MTLPGPLRALLALALLWAASLAPGVMPARAADGGLVLEFCDGAGVVAMTRDAGGRWVPADGAPDAPADRPAPPCAFAAAHVAAAPPATVAPAPAPAALPVALAWPGPAAPAPRAAPWPKALPRGPPAA